MDKQAGNGKSKLYCNQCGSFDLMKMDRTFFAKYIFDEPRKLHCQGCSAKLSFQQIALNVALTPPRFYRGSDDTVLSKNKRGRPMYVTMGEYVASSARGVINKKRPWLRFLIGMASGLVLFGVIVGVFLLTPYSKTLHRKNEVYTQPIMRLGDVELVRLDNTKNKNADIEVVLLGEPKKKPAELVWDGVAVGVERLVPKSTPAISQDIDKIQQDLNRLLEN